MSKSEYQDLIAEYKEQIRILKQEVAEVWLIKPCPENLIRKIPIARK